LNQTFYSLSNYLIGISKTILGADFRQLGIVTPEIHVIPAISKQSNMLT